MDVTKPPACAGDGFSTRAEDAVLHGCLPVIIMDDVDPVFASILDWSAFSIRVAEVNNLKLAVACAWTAAVPEPAVRFCSEQKLFHSVQACWGC